MIFYFNPKPKQRFHIIVTDDFTKA